MYIGFFNHHTSYNKNKMLTDPSSPIGDNLMYPFVCVGEYLKDKGHKINTIDMDRLDKFDAVVFADFPGFRNKYFRKLLKSGLKNLYLIAYESPIIKPDNLDINNHKYFKKIFTWSDDFIDNNKYFKINYSHKIPKNLDFNTDEKKFLCTLISSNKFTHNKNELYTERIKAIRWFEKEHPEDFDLYGKGWDRYYFFGDFLGIKLARLNRLKFITKILKRYYPSYRGQIQSKKETYKNYKFAICYENAEGFSGYITEKIFDCFFSGCIPIYLGAPNINSHIPADTFIDKRNFKTYGELYKYIKNMPEKKYNEYLQAIKKFLASSKAYPFTAEYFAKTIGGEIT